MVGAATRTRISQPLKTFMDSDSLKKKSSRSTKPSDIGIKKTSKSSPLTHDVVKLRENGKRRLEGSLSPEQPKLPNRRSSLVDQAITKSSTIATLTALVQSTVTQSTTTLAATAQSITSQSTATLQRTFGHVVISLENLILPHYRLSPTPSMQEGLDVRTEWCLRRLGCDFIQHSGYILKLPQVIT